MSTQITEVKDISDFETTLCSFCFCALAFWHMCCAQKRKSNAEALSSSLHLAVAFQLLCKCSHKSGHLNLSFIIFATVHSKAKSDNSGVTNCILKASLHSLHKKCEREAD